jgi:hypothetical protein
MADNLPKKTSELKDPGMASSHLYYCSPFYFLVKYYFVFGEE